jgi:hypothetical protein
MCTPMAIPGLRSALRAGAGLLLLAGAGALLLLWL